MDGVFMSRKDQIRYRIVEEFISRRISREECALKLDLSQRQISRIAARMRSKGLEGVKHGNFGRSPANRNDPQLVEAYVSKYRETYFGFNRSHALELMLKHEHFARGISYWAFNEGCRRSGLGKVRRRQRRPRHYRERHPREGYMLQMDGSSHPWFNGEKSCVIAVIDDATGKIPFAQFTATETTWGCMNVLRKVIEREGIPEFILTDTAGWSTGSLKRVNFSQFERACVELGIKLIGTPSPESKGRVERLFRTMQDRLVPELQLYGVKTALDANRYLDQVYRPDHNQRWSVKAENAIRAYKSLPIGTDLNEVFCLKEQRMINRDHTVNYKGARYAVTSPRGQSLYRHWVAIHEYEDGSFRIFWNEMPLGYKKIFERRRSWGLA